MSEAKASQVDSHMSVTCTLYSYSDNNEEYLKITVDIKSTFKHKGCKYKGLSRTQMAYRWLYLHMFYYLFLLYPLL